MTINVVVADDHPIVRYGIRRLLEEREMIHLVGEAANSSELVNLLAKAPCDILVTDFSMPGGNFKDGLFLIGYVRRYFPNIKIIVVTMLENLAILRGMLKLGVHSIRSKLDEQRRQPLYSGGTGDAPARLGGRRHRDRCVEALGSRSGSGAAVRFRAHHQRNRIPAQSQRQDGQLTEDQRHAQTRAGPRRRPLSLRHAHGHRLTESLNPPAKGAAGPRCPARGQAGRRMARISRRINSPARSICLS
ncbi:MAG: response regulator [Pandoraea sp.]|nr:response regulator [Pandoraea sp.]